MLKIAFSYLCTHENQCKYCFWQLFFNLTRNVFEVSFFFKEEASRLLNSNFLSELQKRVGEEGLSAFDRRYAGRVSEILFNVWLNRQMETGALRKEEIREIPVLHMEKVHWLKKGTAFLKARFLGRKYE